ncbi:MAG: LSU ribosomal protein L1p (L10Ae) [Candidatus Woesebacteria bacterium]|jgi:large subunit ribosomal protein L1|nr:MAG: LSU ribosomal protein L1p (L10Ae) [Candidatus Woesebacteria bacterium]
MGKTKTAFVTGLPEENLSGEEKYKERLKKKAEREAKEKAKIEGVGLKGGERIKVVGGEIPEIKEEEKKEEKKAKAKERKRGKKYLAAKQKIDKTKSYKIDEAIKLIKEASYSSFDGTMEAHIQVKKQGLNVSVSLPHSTGKTKKIEVADEKTIAKLEKGVIDFDVLLATPDMMPKLLPFARLLGPKGLLPNPKNGTLIKSKEEAKNFSTDKMTLKTEKEAPLIHTIFGKVSMDDKKLSENLEAIIEAIGRKQIVKLFIKSTMSPSARIDF